MSSNLDDVKALRDAWANNLYNKDANNSARLAGQTVPELKESIIEEPMSEVSRVEAKLDARIARRDNPDQVSRHQVGLGDVSNYPVATEEIAVLGTSNHHYMTPLVTKSLVTSLVNTLVGDGDFTDLLQAVEDLKAAMGEGTDLSALMDLIATKLDKTGIAADSTKFNGLTTAEFVTQVIKVTMVDNATHAQDSDKLGGLTLEELKATWDDVRAGTDENKFVNVVQLKKYVENGSEPLIDHLTLMYGEALAVLEGTSSGIPVEDM